MKSNMKKAINELNERRMMLTREEDSIYHILEVSLKSYDFMIDFAIKKGYKRIVDIGCGYGHQSILCRDRIKYVGIDEDYVEFYNFDDPNNSYSVGKYPFYIPFDMYKKDLAISNLAIGWQCYVDEKEFKEQCKALAEDFKASLLYLPTDREPILKEYFKNIEIYKKTDEKDVVHRVLVPTAFYYCYN